MTPTSKAAAEPAQRGTGYDSQSAPSGGVHRRRRSKRRLLDPTGPVALTALLIVSVAALLGGGGWLGYKIWKYSQYLFAHSWLTEVTDLAAADQGAVAAQRLGADLPKVVSLLPDLQNNPEHTRKQGVVTQLISSLPREVELSPLLSVPPESFAHSAVCSAVAKNATLDWRLEKSCHPDANARKIAISGLRETFPLGLVDDAGMAQLTEPMTLEEKKDLYQRLYQQAHQKVEDMLCGDFRVSLEATYRTDERATMPTESLVTPAPVLHVSCKDRVFAVRMFDQSWTGTFAEFGGCRMRFELGQQSAFSGLRLLQRAPHAVLNLSCDSGHLRIAVSQFPQYAPPRTERQKDDGSASSSSKAGRRSRTYGPQISVTRTDMYGQEKTTIYQGGGVVARFSTSPATPGFEKFEASLVPAR